ncbi:MAG: alpha/beta fold hydrolase [Actinomycetota bacterium]
MATVVLVPGAWLGGWAWDDIETRLRGRGHDPRPVTLTGLGDRADEAGPDVDLETHIADIAKVVEGEGLRDVILVGHSYGGLPVTGAADRIADRLSRVVYVDGGPAPDGTSYVDTMEPKVREITERHVTEEGEGWKLPMPAWDELESVNGASTAGLDDDTKAQIRQRATDQPFATYTRAIHLTNPDREKLPHVLISCSFPLEQVKAMIASGHPWFEELSGPQWSFAEVPTGHWPMFSAPDELAEALDAVARG